MNGAIRIPAKEHLPVVLADMLAMHCMTQRDLAKDSGYFQSQISGWLRADRSMDVTSLIRVAGAFGYDLALVPREDA